MRGTAEDKRKREKEVVELMISVYCRKNMLKHLKTEDFAPNVPLSENMPGVEATDVLLWRLRLFALTAEYTAIRLI